jgi:hypothetical protein
MIKSIGVLTEDYKEFVAVTLLLSMKHKRPVSYREAFGIIVKHYKRCYHAEV